MNSYTELFININSIVKTMKAVCLVIGVILCVGAFAATPQVKNVKAFQQYPWENKVYISYDMVGDVIATAGKGKMPYLIIQAKDKVTGQIIYVSADGCLSGDTGTEAGLHNVVWDISAQGDISLDSTNAMFTVMYCDEVYLVVDLSGGADASSYPVSYLIDVPSDGWTDDYKTAKLVLRLIGPGAFKMCGEYDVSLSKPFYCGIFEVTQKQYELVTGTNPSEYKGDMRPVDNVSWDTIRGNSSIYDWPRSSNVAPYSFMGRLRARTGLNFDLPTEAQWEYACRAGTTSKFNNGGDTEDDLKQLGRYRDNLSDGKGEYLTSTTVGSYLPNAWGLYDMHGNIWEWCLDWYGDLSSGIILKIAVEGNDVFVCRLKLAG